MTQSNPTDPAELSTTEKVDRAESLYSTGDFKAARSLARQILSADDASADHRASAGRILRSSGIDPAAVVVYGLSLGLLAYLLIRYVAL